MHSLRCLTHLCERSTINLFNSQIGNHLEYKSRSTYESNNIDWALLNVDTFFIIVEIPWLHIKLICKVERIGGSIRTTFYNECKNIDLTLWMLTHCGIVFEVCKSTQLVLSFSTKNVFTNACMNSSYSNPPLFFNSLPHQHVCYSRVPAKIPPWWPALIIACNNWVHLEIWACVGRVCF